MKNELIISQTGIERRNMHDDEVIRIITETIKLTKMYDKDCIKSHKMALRNIRKFLTDNFNIKETNDNKIM